MPLATSLPPRSFPSQLRMCAPRLNSRLASVRISRPETSKTRSVTRPCFATWNRISEAPDDGFGWHGPGHAKREPLEPCVETSVTVVETATRLIRPEEDVNEPPMYARFPLTVAE